MKGPAASDRSHSRCRPWWWPRWLGRRSGKPEEDEKITYHVGTTSDMVSANPFKACCTSRVRDAAPELQHAVRVLGRGPLAGAGAHAPAASRAPTTWSGRARSATTSRGTTGSRSRPKTSRSRTGSSWTTTSTRSPTTCRSSPRSRRRMTTRCLEVHGADPGADRAPLHPDPPRAHLGGARRQAAEGDPGVRGHPRGRLRAVPAHRVGERASSGAWRPSTDTSSATPTIDEVVYHVYGNDEAMVQALNSGEIDFAYDLPPTLAGSLEGDENIAIVNEARRLPHEPRLQLRRSGRVASDPVTAPRRRPSRRTTRPCTTTPSGSRSLTRSTSRRSRTSSSRVRRFRPTRSSPPTRRSGIWTSRRRTSTPSIWTRRTGSSTKPGTRNERPTASGSTRRAGNRSSSTSSRSTTPAAPRRSGELMAGWMEEIGIRVRPPCRERDEGVRGMGERDLRRLHLELGRRPGPRLQHVDLHDRLVPRVERRLLGRTPSSTSSTRSSGRRSTGTLARRSCTSSSGSTTRRSRRSTSCTRS